VKKVPAFLTLLATLNLGDPRVRADEQTPPPAPPQTQPAPASPKSPPSSPPPPEASPAVPLPSDEEIRTAVEEALGRDADVAGHSVLRVRCEEGILTLSGKAETLKALQQAERRAGDVRGVLDVVATAEIATAGALDSRILLELHSALDISTFRGDSISVAVEGGVVRVNGTTATYARKLLADKTISEVPGVVEVVNSLVVAAPPEGDDAELARRVRLLLTGGLSPVPGLFDVTVRNGEAALRGKVPLYSHRVQAERLALSVGGVVAVDDRLKVDPSLRVQEATVEVQP